MRLNIGRESVTEQEMVGVARIGGRNGWVGVGGFPKKQKNGGRRQEINEVDSKMGGLRKGPREG